MTDSGNGQPASAKKAQHFIRKNGFSILIALIIVILFVSPEAKSWTIRQLMRTGIYNVRIEKEATALPQMSAGFDFEDEKRVIQNTSSLNGKVVFINFWASWCPPCRAEFPSIETLYATFKDNPDIFFLMINEDGDWSSGREYLQKKGYVSPMYKIKSAAPVNIYNGTLPTTLILDKTGKVVFRHEGFASYASPAFIKQIHMLIKE